ncbi:efflux RND transporter periplasmic adaptor subunit [Rubrivivax albus]|uniref:Efflux RND transporter periplasmic adaptor subunit n=1 Tax=Rubrivivax albus TaxID=2499835 RepID=A0A3S2VWN7_9BURK|nr:efflux RND transporter periplasmic adaptor subunit [Rubrivivax albus]RVT51023.1 efflux RND transporter periplasmic adaptor subunit [Rubrivivax albus]
MSARRRGWLIAGAVLAVVAAAVAWRATRAPAAASAPPPASQVAEATVRLAASDLTRATMQPLARTVAVSGSVQALRTAMVKARIAAELRQLDVREGDTVRAGQVIGRLDDTEAAWRLRQAEDQAASAQAQLTIAERTLANNRVLVTQGFISTNALQTSESNVAAARATLAAAQAAAELARKSVRDAVLTAPIGGQVAQRLAQPGERVGVDARIVEIVDLSALELAAPLAPADVAPLSVGLPATLTVEGLAAPVAGRIARIAPSTQAGTRAVMVYVALDGAPGLRHGLFAQGSVEVARAPARVVPLTAMRTDGARPAVLVVADGRVKRVDVTPGERGLAPFGGTLEPAVAVGDALPEGAVVLRGSVGLLADGTPVTLP